MTSFAAEGDVLSPASRGAGSYTSDPLAGTPQGSVILVPVNITAISGKPRLTIQLQSSTNNGSTWADVASAVVTKDALTSFTLNHKFQVVAGQSGEWVRVVATVDGSSTPTVTFDVSILAWG